MTNINFSMKDTFVLSASKQKTLKEMKQLLLEFMLCVEGNAKRYAPVKTGRLRSSIHTEPKTPSETITVSDGVEYGIYQEFGTVNMKPQPFMRPALHTAIQVNLPILLKKHNFK